MERGSGGGGLLQKKRVLRLLWIVLYGLCGLSVLADFWVRREAHFGLDELWGFYAGLGFMGCVALVLISKVLGWFLKVREDYYDRG